MKNQTYSLLCTEIRQLRKDLDAYKDLLPATVTEALQKHDNKKKLVVVGLSADSTKEKVSKLLSLGGVPPEGVRAISLLGKPHSPKRPICVELSSQLYVPHLKTLAATLKNSPCFSHCSVRLFETPEERHEAYLAREQRRKAENPVEVEPIDAEPDVTVTLEPADTVLDVAEQSIVQLSDDSELSPMETPRKLSTPVIDSPFENASPKSPLDDNTHTVTIGSLTFDKVPKHIKDYDIADYAMYVYVPKYCRVSLSKFLEPDFKPTDRNESSLIYEKFDHYVPLEYKFYVIYLIRAKFGFIIHR